MAQRKTPRRARTARREAVRARGKLGRERDRLMALEAGGSPERPIEVESPSVVELRAAALCCPYCEVQFRVEAHRAPSTPGMRLREAAVSCPRCGRQRSIWFRLVGPSLN